MTDLDELRVHGNVEDTLLEVHSKNPNLKVVKVQQQEKHPRETGENRGLSYDTNSLASRVDVPGSG